MIGRGLLAPIVFGLEWLPVPVTLAEREPALFCVVKIQTEDKALGVDRLGVAFDGGNFEDTSLAI